MTSSALLRLRQLPRVFTQAHALVRLGWNVATGRMMLSRWVRKTWITALGPRAGVYANTAPAEVTMQDRLLGLAAVTPSAVLIGASSYAAAGVRYFDRPPSWYRRAAPGLLPGLVPRLRPEWAWLDALANPGPWHPDPDELDLDQIARGRAHSSCQGIAC